VQRSRIRWPWRTPIIAPTCSLDDSRRRRVPWICWLTVWVCAFGLAFVLSSCTVLVESDAFRTLTAPTADASLSFTPSASPSPSKPSQSTTPSAPKGDSQPLPAAWLRDLAWAHLVEKGIADQTGEPVWDDTCGPASYCWGAWRLQFRRLEADAETDRFGVTAVGAGGIVVEMVVASDAVVSVQAVATAIPQPTRHPRPSLTPEGQASIYVVTLHSLPAGSTYDDMVRIWSSDLGQMGVRGVDDTLEQALAALRDTGRLVIVRAWREDGVADYGNARLVVERITEEGPLPERQRGDRAVEGWVGTIVPLPSAASYDDYFDSRWPGGQYGIAANDAALADALTRLRDSGEMVRVWGLLRENAADYGEASILVIRIELAEIGDGGG